MYKKILIALFTIVIILLITFSYPLIRDKIYNNKLKKEIYINTNIRNIEYINKDNNYYILIDEKKLYVLDFNFNIIYTLDKNSLYGSKLDIVYKDNKLLYEEVFVFKDKIEYVYYNVIDNKYAFKVVLGGD